MKSVLLAFNTLISKIKKLRGNIEIELELEDIYTEIKNSINIQQSSSGLLLMNVEDILGYA